MNGGLVPSGTAESVGVLAVIVLVVLLIGRELAAAGGTRSRPLARNLTIIIAPLLVLFIMIGANRVLSLLVPLDPSAPASSSSSEAAQAGPGPATTPNATAAVPGTPAAPASGSLLAPPRLIMDESFGGRRPGWPDDPQGSAWFDSTGGYYLAAREPSRFVAVGVPFADVLRDVLISASFRKVGGPPGGGYGIILRDQGPSRLDGKNQGGNYYVLEVGDLGEVGIWRRVEDHWQDLVPWTPATGVHPGTQPNELVASADGERLSLIVNGVLVASATDATPAEGRVGIFAGGDSNQVALEHLVVETPNGR